MHLLSIILFTRFLLLNNTRTHCLSEYEDTRQSPGTEPNFGTPLNIFEQNVCKTGSENQDFPKTAYLFTRNK